VLLLAADYPPAARSGIGPAVARQAEALAARGVEVEVLVAGEVDGGGGGGRERRLGKKEGSGSAVFAGRERARRNGQVENGCAPGGRLVVRHLDRRRFPLDPRGCDVVHVHSLRLAGLGIELRRRFGLPLAVTVHAQPRQELGETAQGLRWGEVQRRLLWEADRIVFLSRAEREAALAEEPRLAARSVVVPNGLPQPRRVRRQRSGCHPERERGIWAGGGAKATPGAPVVFAGRLTTSKGADLLLDLLPLLAARIPNPFVLAGGVGDPELLARARAVAAALGTRCRITGWLPPAAMARLYRRAALVLVPSRYEPFGLVALEAMAAGAPVLAADVGGQRDVVGDGAAGRRLASRDPERWAEAAADLLASGEAERLAARGPAWVAARFPIATVAARLEREVYGGRL
jgi:glycosyltransferase involved in cell wall biosynthesis